MEFVTGGIASCAAVVFTNPVEVTKIRMQLQGELQARGQYSVQYKNPFHAMHTIYKAEGMRALQKGLAPAIGYQFVFNGMRLGLFSWFTREGHTKDKFGKVSPVKTIAASATSGIIGSFLATPFELVRLNCS